MKIADVFNEKSKEYYRQENASEYAYITADEYTPKEVIEMEKKILTLLDFNCFMPIVPHYLAVVKVSEPVKILSDYLADLMLLSTKTLKFKPSLIANAILFLACDVFAEQEGLVLKNGPIQDDIKTWKTLFEDHTLEDFCSCVRTVRMCWADIKTSSPSKHYAVDSKYENQELVPVKEVKIPEIPLVKLERWYYIHKGVQLPEVDNQEMQVE